MYSPFLDSRGVALEIRKVKFCHLEQLKECEEGHHLEYKRLLEDGGKVQLAKEITSFANSEGGWLIVGIDDKSREIMAIDKFDYSQKVGKIATRISPMPEFETKFLPLPNDKDKGVLLIYVYEGKNAPYICNGSVYVRSGSNKEPIIAANRGNIEYLEERSKLYEKELIKFFKRDYYFPYSDKLHKIINYPIACIYLKNIGSKRDNWLNVYKNRDKLIKFINSDIDIFESIQYTMNSMIFQHKRILPSTNSGTFIFEVFYDWSCKIYIPLAYYNQNETDLLKQQFINIGIAPDIVKKLKLISGGTTCNAITCYMCIFEKIAKKYRLKEKNYAFCFEVENAAENILAFCGDTYQNYFKKYGIAYSSKETNISRITYFKDYPNFHFRDLINSIVVDFLGAAFGFRSDTIHNILNEDNQYRYGKNK